MKNGRVLITDDERSLLEILDQFLSKKGYTVSCADCAEEAVELIDRDEFDVALIDLKLPDRSGIDIVRHLRDKQPRTRCIIMTAYASVESSIEALRLNTFDYVRKPFDLVKIGEVVDAAYGYMMLQDQNSRIIDKLEKANKRLEKRKNDLSRKIMRTNEELARANESLKNHVTRLKMLYQMGRDISSDENWSDALDRFLMALCKYLDAEGAALLLFSDSGKTLNVRTTYQLEEEFLTSTLETLRDAHGRDLTPSEIFSLESYDGERIFSCLEMRRKWRENIIPLIYKGRWLGFLLVRKVYHSRLSYLSDYHFLNTIQTILSEEVANAVTISKLRNLKNFNETILNNINSGVLTTDRDGRIIFLNNRARDLVPDSLEQLHFDDLFVNPFGSGSLFEHLIGSDKPNGSVEVVLSKGDFSVPVRLNTSVVELDDYHGKTLIAIFDDLTEQKRMEEELRRADRLRSLGELSAGVAHEIRNPLTGIATTAQVLREKLADEKDKIKYLTVILDEINRLDGIIKNLLLFAKPQTPNPTKGSISEVLNEVVALLSEKALEHRVRVSIENTLEDDQCIIDRGQIKQVVLNIALNGIEACNEGGNVAIVLGEGEEPSFIRVMVEDSGRGIPAELEDRLYNPFFTTKSNGTGLGLSISRKIVEAHGGRLYHESVEGKGTKFFVEIPRKMAAAVSGNVSSQ
ncbi:MAG: hypothetical protein B6D63_07295 [Candidatus Latescibacteria bacterium 4484_7]|nr:MAG: hypothetical protein B6D63_07295 [Candidatus Latescibacteria bacterium 4484_7]